ncbi:MAG TPA: penicillin-binding protein 2 [Candidatus Paceibacterota bacterium]|nr:penicillin-binding protein 2 [Candidatus Paceibacterota bacterium]
MGQKSDSTRIYIVFGCVLAAATLIAWRLFTLSYVNHTIYAQTAEAQNENISNIFVRGNIYLQDPTSSDDSHWYLVATNKKFEKDRNGQTEYETDRYYPARSLAASVLGFFGYNSQGRAGQYGIEAYFDSELAGRAAAPAKKSDGQPIHGFWNIIKHYVSSISIGNTNPDDISARPADVVLTVDRNIQTFAEQALDKVLKKWNASGGTVIVQDPQTGKILAMADEPTFDPNAYSDSPPQNYLNKNVQQMFEPGSSFKPITMAMGLDLGKVTPDTTYTDPGVVTIAGKQIHNFDNQAHGTVSMTTVLEKSLNTGAMFVEDLVGDDNFLNYAINFGFGQKTGIDLPGEVPGDIANLYSGRKINAATASFGQGIAVTPIQLITAYSAIANGGKLMKPYVVDRVIYEGGREEVTQPEVVSIPISQKTSDKLKTMLVSVVNNGFDKARIKGYDIAGKTGTAQIADGHGGYEDGVFIHDFLGFAPANDPKFVILIKMDRPQGITFASDSLSSTFRDIAQYLINYYNIPPTN